MDGSIEEGEQNQMEFTERKGLMTLNSNGASTSQKFWTDKHGRTHKKYIEEKGDEITQCKYDPKDGQWKLYVKRKKVKMVKLT